MTSERTFVVVPPDERPRRQRRTARVLLVDDHDRVLLFADTDPGLAGSSWWITPGGGIEADESDRAAAVRELAEETGLVVSESDLLGPLMVRHVVHGYTDVVIEQEDVFFACWVPAFDVSAAGHTEEEKLTMTGHRWWTRGEFAVSHEEVWPTDLPELWADADARRTAGQPLPPAAGGSVEESTVPA